MCSDCHTPHHNLPASNPASSIHPDNLAATCGASSCHADDNVNASFLTFMPHSDPMNKDQNPWVHYIYIFMTLLLLGVFGFFGLHALLWLQRTLVGRLRGEFKVEHFGPGPYVRRFSTTQMWLHMSIILSFLLLSVTGLPLKFAAAPWAPGLMKALGGPDVAAWLHRFAAIVTFGYFAVHLGMLFYDVAIKRKKGFFWGWQSMTPNLKDLQDLIANLKYFLYLGPRPELDRWAYWEKFDYLAVFWGVGMIGVSGLMLWFPDFFTQFLPGWALNAAYIIHSDEALLATGFIFLFHFFHTHLRPESFPMDPVIFTGSQTLAALQARAAVRVPAPGRRRHARAALRAAAVEGADPGRPRVRLRGRRRRGMAGVPDLQGDRQRRAAPVLAARAVMTAGRWFLPSAGRLFVGW